MLRKTKIIATLGPATDSPEVLQELILAGANVFRLNMSHAPAEWCRSVTARVREAAMAVGRDVGVLMDLRGPTIRTGDVSLAYTLKPGDTVEFTLSDAPATLAISTTVNYPGLYADLKPDDTVLVDNGILQMRVVSTAPERVICTVLNQGVMGSRRHINLPGIKVNLPPLTDKDFDDMKLAAEIGIDFVAMSFVRDASHLHLLREELIALGCQARIVAKIEDQQAVRKLDEIIEASDVVMVARGDLGIEVHLEELPVLQRKIVSKCVTRGRSVIVATHMLESMIQNPVPTRAEVTDVANAIFEEADAIMLSGETSSGAFPVKCVEIMVKIAHRVEAASTHAENPSRFAVLDNDKQRIVKQAVSLADSLEEAVIIVFTARGVLARYAAWFRPAVAPIFAFTPSAVVARGLQLSRAVQPHVLEFNPGQPHETIASAVAYLKGHSHVVPGQTLVIISDVLQGEFTVNSILVQQA
jgi:pyruvate kinase